MSKILLDIDSKYSLNFHAEKEKLNVSEFFSHTIQGEGRYIGYPAVFLRLKGCILNCIWCDTMDIWKKGSTYSLSELFVLMEEKGVISFLEEGAHLVLTGGSPLLQQNSLVIFINRFIDLFDFKPFIEIENECTIIPDDNLIRYIDHWNCSPKLSNSLQKKEDRYNPQAIRKIINSDKGFDFKFVISNEKDWEEIEKDFLETELVKLNHIILMPEGEMQEELSINREKVVNLAIEKRVRFSDRLHITIWNRKVGV